ncbi:hypothetical protein Tco_1162835 [Tanacetum coccineum]
MDPSSSKTCLGENVIKISSDKGERHGDWNSPEFQDTANSGGKKEAKAMVFHKMETEEISDIFVAIVISKEETQAKGGEEEVLLVVILVKLVFGSRKFL